MNIKIADLELYNEGMRKSLIDKSFFLNIIDSDVMVDFGCADATLLKHAHSLNENVTYIGYDISSEMLKKAKENFPEGRYFDSWILLSAVLESIIEEDKTKKVTLVLSSILHEIYSYADIEEFWDNILSIPFDNIVIRDMMISRTAETQTDINDIVKLRRNAQPQYLKSFVSRWGDITQTRNFIHYLLKYSYTDNWKREVRENYLPIHIEDLLLHFPIRYKIEYFNHEVLPYLKNKVMQDFGIELRERTHVKIILSRK